MSIHDPSLRTGQPVANRNDVAQLQIRKSGGFPKKAQTDTYTKDVGMG